MQTAEHCTVHTLISAIMFIRQPRLIEEMREGERGEGQGGQIFSDSRKPFVKIFIFEDDISIFLA